MDEQLRTILIIILSVSIFGLIVFVMVKEMREGWNKYEWTLDFYCI